MSPQVCVFRVEVEAVRSFEMFATLHRATPYKKTLHSFITVKTWNLIEGSAYQFHLRRTVLASKFESFFNFIVGHARYSFSSHEDAYNSRINNRCEGGSCRHSPIIVPQSTQSLWRPVSASSLLGAPARFGDHYEPPEKTFIPSNCPNSPENS